jgi:hypothetical protein
LPLDEEQPEIALAVTDEAKRMLQGKLVSSGIAGVLSLIPGVGAAITELLTELAIQRTNNRVKEMFDYFTNRICDIGEEKVDREWFRSEEFQTLLYEAIQQLHVTHDQQKIEMLGVALANSGESEFKAEDRKDLFVRFVRELTMHHIKLLVELAPGPPNFENFPPDPQIEESMRREAVYRWRWKHRPRLNPQGDDLLALQMLHGYGLVEETRSSSIKEPSISSISSAAQVSGMLKNLIKDIENATITRYFRLSPLGDAFLKFMGLPKGEAAVDPSVKQESL